MSKVNDRPLRVALAGFGVVGGGVYERLTAKPDRYEVNGVLCRNPARRSDEVRNPATLTDDPQALGDYDILVEAIGGVSPADAIVIGALSRGADVATANKTLVARRFADIETARGRSGAAIRYSAAVGGGVPMLETVDRIAAERSIGRIEAVLNGTTNFILERISDGASLEAAIAEAQTAGFAEADPSADIDGRDAAEKLSLLARRAFGIDIAPDDIPAEPLASAPPEKILAAAAKGTPYKQVAMAQRVNGGFDLSVRLIPVDGESPLARPRREENVLVVTPEAGAREVVFGKGAGRGPTADSLFSDIEALYLSRAACSPSLAVTVDR